MLAGILCMGFFLSFLRAVGWGTDPYTFMNESIRLRLGWTLGNWQLLLNAVLFVLVVVVNRRLIGLGTVANWVLIGYTADFCNWLWTRCIPAAVFADAGFLWLKAAIFAAALFGFVVSAAVYMNAKLGLSPYDATAALVSAALPRLPFAPVRIAYDALAVVVGLAVTAGTGINLRGWLLGTLCMAVALGPVIQLVGAFMQKHVFGGE